MLRQHPLLLAFVAAYMLWSTGRALVAGNVEFLFYAAVMAVLIGGLVAIHARVGFSTPLLWALAIWGLLHMAGGNVPIPWSLAPDHTPDPARPATVLYNLRLHPWLPKYDQAVHAYGFAVATLACFRALASAVPGLRVSAGIAVACLLMGVGLGAMNELVEFVATRITQTNVGGYENTGWDLVSNFIGATLAAAWIYARHCPAQSGG